MKRKFLAILTAICLTTGLAACGGGTTSSTSAPASEAATSAASSEAAATEAPAETPASGEKTKIVYWNQLSGGDGDVMKAMVDEYNAGDNMAEVEMTILKSEEYYSKLITAMATQDAPDVAVSHMSSLTEFVTESYLYPLDDLAGGAGLDWGEFTDRLVEGIAFDGNHYAVPLDTHVFLLHYNTNILGDMGLMDDNNHPTYDIGEEAFLTYFRDVKGKLADGMMPISGTSQNELPLYMWWTLYTQQGGKMISDDGTAATLDNEENLKALTFMKTIVEEDIWPKNQKNGGEIFTSLTASATFNGNWGIPLFEKAEGLEFISLPFPQIFDQKSVFADSHTLIMPVQKEDDAAKQAATMDFMNWMASNTLQWAQGGHIPSKKAVVESAEYKALPYRSEYAQSAEWATFYPKTTKITGMKASFTRIFASMISGEYTPEQARDLMQEELSRLLSE